MQPLELHAPLKKQLDTIFVVAILPHDAYEPDIINLIKYVINMIYI